MKYFLSCFKTIWILILLLDWSSTALAQSQIPIRENLWYINKVLRERYNLFPEEEKSINRIEFHETYDEQIEAKLTSSGKIFNTTKRKIITQEEFTALKHLLDEPSPELEKAQISQNFQKRYKRMFNSSVFASGLVHFPFVFSSSTFLTPDDDISLFVNYGILRLGVPAAMTIGAYIINQNRIVNPGESSAYVSGALTGRIKGEILSSALFSFNSRNTLPYSLVTGVVGIGESVLSAAFANKYQLSSSHAGWVGTGNFYGTWIGAGIGYSLQNKPGLGMVVGTYAGAVAGAYFNMKNYPFLGLNTRSKQAIQMAGLIGGTLGLGLVSFGNSDRFLILKTVLPAGAFVAASSVALRHVGLSKKNTDLFVYLPAITGSLVGIGGLIVTNSEDQRIIGLVGSSMALTWLLVFTSTYKNHYRKDATIVEKKQRKTVSYKFNPEGIFFHRLGEKAQSWTLINQVAPSILQAAVPLNQSTSMPIQYAF